MATHQGTVETYKSARDVKEALDALTATLSDVRGCEYPRLIAREIQALVVACIAHEKAKHAVLNGSRPAAATIDAPVESPVELAPVESALVEAAVLETVVAGEAPVDAALVEPVVVEAARVESVFVEEAPIEAALVESAVGEAAPVEASVEQSVGLTPATETAETAQLRALLEAREGEISRLRELLHHGVDTIETHTLTDPEGTAVMLNGDYQCISATAIEQWVDRAEAALEPPAHAGDDVSDTLPGLGHSGSSDRSRAGAIRSRQ
jgi:hypothetical protein